MALQRTYCLPEFSKRKISDLSSKDIQIVSLVSEGKTNKEIADSTGLALGTIRQYLYIIFKKIKVRNRTELAVLMKETL